MSVSVRFRPAFQTFKQHSSFTYTRFAFPPRAFTTMSANSAFTLTLKPGQTVNVTLPDGLSQSQLESFRPWNSWISRLSASFSRQSDPVHPFHQSPYSLRSVTIQSYDLFGGQRLGFVKLTAQVTNQQGESLPAAALLRGPSVAVLVTLIPDDVPRTSDERYAVLTVQPRVPAGTLDLAELPAGMVDDAGSFRGAAAKEMEEELGVTFGEEELTCLSELAAPTPSVEDEEAAMFPSAGGCDESVTIYSAERRVPRTQLKEWQGRLTGLREHGEKITLKVVPMKDLFREGARDAKALASVALWEGLKREGKI